MSFQPGDLIWAKMRGYPHWPARIDLPAPDEKIPAKKFPIFFYGTHETAVMLAKDLFDYEKYKSKFGKQSTRRFFNEALEEIVKDPKVRYGQRGMPVESESEESSESEDEEDEEKEEEEEKASTKQKQTPGKRRISTENKTPAKKKAKTAKPVESDSEEPEETDEPEESSESDGDEYVPEVKIKKEKQTPAKNKVTQSKGKSSAKKSKRMISSDESSEDEEEKEDTKKKNKNTKKKSESEDSSQSEEEKTKKKISEQNDTATKHKQLAKENKTKNKDDDDDDDDDDGGDGSSKETEEGKKKKEEMEKRKQEKLEKRKEELKEKKRKEKLEQKAKQKEKEKLEKEKEKERKLKEKEKEKERALKEKEKEKARMEREKQKEKERREKEKQKEKEKIEWQKQKERLKHPTIYDTLELCNQDLKLSLTVEAPDIHRCLNTLNKINEMQISPEVIKKSPAIVQTIKKIRNYKQSNKVRERASELYTKLKSLFVISGTDAPTATPTTKTTSDNPLTPTEQKTIEKTAKPPVTPEERVDGKLAPDSDIKPVLDFKEQSTVVEMTAVHDKENLLLDHQTQNGAHTIENQITSHAQDPDNSPIDAHSYIERSKESEIPRNDDQTEILTPCDMEISSPI